jgi:hypothetical protein
MSKTSQRNDATRYYHQQDIIRPIGGGVLIVGLLLLFLRMGFISYILATVFIPVGLVLFLVGGSKLVSESDVQELVDHAMLDYDKSITNMNGYERIVLKQPAPVEMEAYTFGENAKYFKRGKNSTPVSDVFTRTHLFYTKDSLMIVGRTLCISELNEAEGKGITDVSEQISIAGIKSASLDVHETTVTLTNTGKPVTVKWCELVIMGHSEELMRIPTKNDMDASGLVDDLNRRCGA